MESELVVGGYFVKVMKFPNFWHRSKKVPSGRKKNFIRIRGTQDPQFFLDHP